MDTNSNEDLQLEKILEQNHKNARQKYEEAYQRSESNQRIKYGQKKNRNKTKLKIAITSIALVAAMALTAGVSSKLTTSYINNNNAIISTSIASDEVDDTIDKYGKLMNMYADKENSIETYLGQTENYEPKVDYTENNIDNLANHLINSAKVSESETRCAIIAAYKIINIPYRDEVLGKALAKASAIQDENSNYKIPNNTKELLEKLGYENWEDYNINERANIKDLKAAEEYVGGKNR